MTEPHTTATVQPVTHHLIRNTLYTIGTVFVLGLVVAGGYWVWTVKDSGTQMRAAATNVIASGKEAVATGVDRTAEIGGQFVGKQTPATNAAVVPAAAPAPAVQQQASSPAALSKTEADQLTALLLKQAVNVLPPPNNGNVGVMVQTAKIGTPPSKDCRELVGTKHDPATKGTIQIWKRC